MSPSTVVSVPVSMLLAAVPFKGPGMDINTCLKVSSFSSTRTLASRADVIANDQTHAYLVSTAFCVQYCTWQIHFGPADAVADDESCVQERSYIAPCAAMWMLAVLGSFDCIQDRPQLDGLHTLQALQRASGRSCLPISSWIKPPA